MKKANISDVAIGNESHLPVAGLVFCASVTAVLLW